MTTNAAVLGAVCRRERLDAQIAELAATARFASVVGRLSCLRGVGTLTAFALAVEIGDFHRLSGRTIGAYLGLVPSESQSGAGVNWPAQRPPTTTPAVLRADRGSTPRRPRRRRRSDLAVWRELANDVAGGPAEGGLSSPR